jgi:hypothetical protein
MPGAQLTWMDAKVGDWVVTPRIGKPVRMQALWLNAQDRRRVVRAGRDLERAFRRSGAPGSVRRASPTGRRRSRHRRGVSTLRSNQLFAVSGLPDGIVGGERAHAIVDLVELALWTPLGPRTLAPGEPGYAARYEGGVTERDGAYHQGTVWPWLAGAFVEAWVRVRGATPEAKREARERFSIRCSHILTGLGHAESPTATHRMRRAGARFRRGRWSRRWADRGARGAVVCRVNTERRATSTVRA